MSKQGIVQFSMIMSSLLIVAFGYNNCSDQSFEFQVDERRAASVDSEGVPDQSPEATPTLLINNNADYTMEADVNLTLSTGAIEADEMFISNDDQCAGGTWEPYQKNKAWTLSAENQEVAVYAKYRMNGDDETDCVTDGIIHDNIAPVINITTQTQNGWIASRNLSVIYTAEDSGSGIAVTECARDNSGVFNACGQLISFFNLIELQNYEMIVQAIDRAGNKSDPAQLNWAVDLTAPVVVFNLTPSATTADITPDFAYTATDAGSGVDNYECRLDAQASFAVCQPAQTLSGLADGSHTLHVRATDKLGHISEEIAYSWIQDSAAPTVMFVSTPDLISNQANATFAFQGLDGGAPINNFQCKLDNGAYGACSSPRNLSNLSDGNHTFSVIGQDSVGNMSAPISYSWLIDTVKPTISYVNTPDNPTVMKDADFQVSTQDNAGGSGIARVECRLDSSAFQTCQNVFNFSNLNNGSHTVQARAIDRATNVSDVISYTWVIDTLKPTVMITKTPANPTAETTAQFEFMASDGSGSGIDFIECRVDGNSFSNCNSPKNYSNLVDGSHTFYVRATDVAGNQSDIKNYTWLVDLTPPVASFVFEPGNNVYVGDDAKIQFAANDGNGSGIASVTCQYNGNTYANCMLDTNILISAASEASHTFTVTVRDNVGNQATITTSWVTSIEVIEKMTTFNVDTDRPVDILFIVDNSGSMNAERSNLAQRINGFLTKINGLDWQIAVISTDVRTSGTTARDGRLIEFMGLPGEFVLDSTMDQAQAQSYLGNTIQNFTGGSGAEQGIWATKRSIDRYIAGEANPTQFFRNGADFAAIVLSDEDENSQGTNIQISSSDFVSFVGDTWNNQKNFTWHSIITKPGDSACKNSQGYAFYGDIYDELSRLTGFGQPGGAIIGSVCEQDYAGQLNDIGQSVKDMQKTITLECVPVDTTGDGNPDIAVELNPSGGSSYNPYPGNFQVQQLKLVFDDFLIPGDYKISYSCAAN